MLVLSVTVALEKEARLPQLRQVSQIMHSWGFCVVVGFLTRLIHYGTEY